MLTKGANMKEEIARAIASEAYHDHPAHPSSCLVYEETYGRGCPCENGWFMVQQTKIERDIHNWMRFNASEYHTATDAAENCAWELDETNTWLDDELHPVWSIALEYVEGE